VHFIVLKTTDVYELLIPVDHTCTVKLDVYNKFDTYTKKMRLNLKHKRNMPVSPPTEANHTKKQQNIEQPKVSHIFPRSEHNRSKPHQETKYRAAKGESYFPT
jgi:hypothetical protein